ncbi:glycoside hydrolase family 3 N-terminal domain-containing protein [Carboxylicivirga sp. M1479]|uniref:glycoside hydrolase family 3 N-terminal domain-containing protein n=1 Tax=Carboxylicivirga sp. M1479 TaxID=2594476 RepID=UPI0021020A6D|nr:glycoside hydrolase family 3 N-terminal domain-containing protein [Carboxylicivirga sp. M1479]
MSLLGCDSQKEPSKRGWESYSQDPVIEHKVDSILSLMTIEEKVGQLGQFSGHTDLTGPATGDDFRTYVDKGLVGSIFNVFGVEALTQIQKHAIEKSRLNIPLLFAADVIHGYKTIFPIPLAESCSWDLALMEKTARAAALEATSDGISWNFAPMIDVARDPRWGRVMEGAGEDTYLGSLVAAARVTGFQGIKDYSDFSDPNTLMACAKHFVAYGAAEAGRDYNTVDVSDHRLRETYFPPFEAAVEAGVASFMTAFNEVFGVPCTGSKYLYTDVLRDEWGFKGMVVTDYTAILEMIDHGFSEDLKEAAMQSINAGIDMDMKSMAFSKHLAELVKEGKVPESAINQAAARVLEMKFLLGLFDNPYKYLDHDRANKWVSHPDHYKLALEAAKRSIVLLKNDDHILPMLPNKMKQVALIGPMIKERSSLNGEWAIKGDRNESITLYEGLMQEYSKSKVSFSYAKGCGLEDEDDMKGLNEAIRIAQNSDVILLGLGENYHWSGEAASRTNIKLPEPQLKLMKALKKTNKPIILVLFNGRPLNLSWEDDNIEAIVEAWYPGTMAGEAVANVLSGKYNPSAKLTLTFPRNVGQIPIYYNHKNTGRPYVEGSGADYRSSYRDVQNSPLYPFGYGLSYSTFEYSDLKLSTNTIFLDGEIKISLEVKNKSGMAGEEIVQLYIQDVAASVTRPVKELKDFKKIHLEKGESKNVTFSINKKSLTFLGQDKTPIVEPGKFRLWVGQHSADERLNAEFELLNNN